jgi:hypothetical protein
MTDEQRQAFGRKGRSFVGLHYSRDILARSYYDAVLSVAREAQQRRRRAVAKEDISGASYGW